MIIEQIQLIFKKGNLIKNLEIKGTAEVDGYNGVFMQYPANGQVAGAGTIDRAHNAINLTIQNCICKRTRVKTNASIHMGVLVLFLLTILYLDIMVIY